MTEYCRESRAGGAQNTYQERRQVKAEASPCCSFELHFNAILASIEHKPKTMPNFEGGRVSEDSVVVLDPGN